MILVVGNAKFRSVTEECSLFGKKRNMKLRYSSVLYEYRYECHTSQTELSSQSEQVLSYRGIFYSQELRSPKRAPEARPAKLLASNYLKAIDTGKKTDINTCKDVPLLA